MVGVEELPSIKYVLCSALFGPSGLRSGTYHGSHGSVRPGIAFRGHVYQPTEMALVMNGGTVSLVKIRTTEPRSERLCFHVALFCPADARRPDQLHWTTFMVTRSEIWTGCICVVEEIPVEEEGKCSPVWFSVPIYEFYTYIFFFYLLSLSINRQTWV